MRHRLSLFAALILASLPGLSRAESTIGALFMTPPDGTYEIDDVSVKLPVKDCVILFIVEEGTPAYEAGLRTDDIITHVGGESVGNADAAKATFAKAEPGKPIAVAYRRPLIRGQHVNWRHRTARVKPVEYVEFLKTLVKAEANSAANTTLYHFHSDEHSLPNSTQLDVLLVQNGSVTIPVLKPTYVGDLKWLFARNLTFVTRDERIEVKPDFGDWKRDNTHERTWEWCALAGCIAQGSWESRCERLLW